MLYGKVLRPSAFEATLVSVDTKKAEQMGVTVVHDGNFMGVAAASSELAAAAAAAAFTRSGKRNRSPEQRMFDYLRKNTAEGKDPTGDGDRFDTGSVDEALKSADHRLQQTYTVPYIAHVPLEPRAAVAKWDGDQLTVWTGTQRPFGVRGELAEAFHIPEDQIRVLMPDTGSGYGGKHTGETAIEAARLARAAKRPVKVGVDARRRIHLGLLPSGGRDRCEQRRAQRWHDHGMGVSQLQLRIGGDSDVLRDSEPAYRLSSRRSLRCGRVRIAHWRPRRITLRASRTWTNWRMR